MYDNRAQLVIRLIRLNRILSAMSTFVADVKDASRLPFTLGQFEDFIVAMRIQTKQHSTTQPAPKQVDTAIAPELWRPMQLDPSIPAKSLSIPAQCMYAIASIYDVCIEQGFRPTSKMVSATLSTFVGNLGIKQLHQATNQALQHLVPSDCERPEEELRKIGHRALSTLIKTYGWVGKPKKGEALLRRWAQAQRVDGFPKDAAWLRMGKEGEEGEQVIDLAGWGNNVVIWQSLIQSSIDANDLTRAKVWLDRYRLATKSRVVEGVTLPPAIKAEPYLAYMVGVRDARLKQRRSRAKTREERMLEMREIVMLMLEDSVPIESSVLAFVIEFETKSGNIGGGTSLVGELSGVLSDNEMSDVGLIMALLEMRKATATATSSSSISDSISGLPSTRSLIRKLVLVGEGQLPTARENLTTCRSRGTLNIALSAALAAHDYPAAIVVLNLFEHWRITPSHTTYCIVLDALIAQGHHLAIFAVAGEIESTSKVNCDATLQSMAREGNGEQAKVVRRAYKIGGEVFGEIFEVTAQPSATLRQTQYLVRVLNRVCAAEIRGVTDGRNGPKWVRDGCVEVGVRGKMSDEKVAKRVKFHVVAAQNEILGKSKEKRAKSVGIKSARKAPLLISAPTISPRRLWFEPRTQAQKVGARAFSTSPSRAEQPTGESCDLASAAASADFTHLDPVRTVFIPGFVPYHVGLALQEHLVKQRADARAALRAIADTSSNSASTLAGLSTIQLSSTETLLCSQAAQDTLVLLQHRPVYTEGRRHDYENQLVSSHLRSLGADYYLTKRGGQITYHGPGQLVGYPILNLASMNLASRCYVDKIQDSLISLLADRGVGCVEPPENHTGVWADEYHKIASIGIQVRHRISSHGFALNVEKRAMRGFRHIVACGIVGRNMTCLQDRLDPKGPFASYNSTPIQGKGDEGGMVESVAKDYKQHFSTVFGRRIREVGEEEFLFELGKEDKAVLLRDKLQVEVKEEEGVVERVTVDGKRVQVE